jgi:predicted Zn-dependent protease
VTEIRAALELEPGNPAIESALAEALVRAHDLGEAIPLLERLTRAQPDAGSLLLMYGDALLQSQQLDRAIEILEQATKATNAPPESRALLGRAYVQAGRYQDAVPHLEASVPADQDGDVHYQLARAYQALGRTDEARKALDEYRRRQPPQTAEPAGDQPAATLTPPNE